PPRPVSQITLQLVPGRRHAGAPMKVDDATQVPRCRLIRPVDGPQVGSLRLRSCHHHLPALTKPSPRILLGSRTYSIGLRVKSPRSLTSPGCRVSSGIRCWSKKL